MGNKEFEDEPRELDGLGEEVEDAVFGKLTSVQDVLWIKEEVFSFMGQETPVQLSVFGKESECCSYPFTEGQYEAYEMLKAKWDDIQQQIMEAILQYYIKTREELGYAEEENEGYPEIRTVSQLQEHIALDQIRIDPESFYDGRRSVGLGFDCSWDDYNGVGVQLVEETVYDIGYMDIIW